MSTAQAVELRSPYVDFWNTVLVPKFNTWRHILSGGLSLHSEKVFPALALRSSDHVLDVGCGWGDTTIKIAHRLGPTGSVVGLDCCDGFLEAGRAEVKAAGLTNVTFLEADVQTYPFKPVYDFCFSRFGTQFFENPVAGLRNMRVALKPDGIMTMIVWRTRQLQIAGYSDIKFERIDAEVLVGRDVDEAVAFQLAIGPAGEVYRAAGKEAERQHDVVAAALKKELANFLRPNGVVMDSSSWMVTARNPG